MISTEPDSLIEMAQGQSFLDWVIGTCDRLLQRTPVAPEMEASRPFDPAEQKPEHQDV